ncbi:MAG: FHA domain-containing protein [Actinomycetota bacterium]
MTEWWSQDQADRASQRPDPVPAEPAPQAGAGRGRRPRIAALGANTVAVGLTAGVASPIVGLIVAALINRSLLADSEELHLGVRSIAVALLLGGALSGWGPLSAGQLTRGARRAAVAGLGTAVVAASLLPIADRLWVASRADGEPGSLAVLVGSWVVIGGLAGAVAGVEDGVARARAGLVGGCIGGLIGGLAFAALAGDFRVTQESSGVSQLAGYLATALGIGLGVGVSERLARSIWLVAVDGPQAGREYILYRRTSAVGVADDCEVYVGPDPEVAAHHAQLERNDGRLEVRPTGGPVEVDRQPFSGGTVADGSVLRIGSSYLRVVRR